jgi:uncharacterized glyoxalase superfamily protein PhnB
MKVSSKPAGYSSVSPYLVVTGAQRVVDFLKQAFDGTELRRYDRPDGTIMHTEVKIDDTVVMIADASEQFPSYPSSMHVYVPDADDTYRRALAAGGVAIEEPKQRPGDPDRRGGVKDPSGNSWWVSTPVA